MTSIRQRLPNRRASKTFDIEIAGLRYTATVSRFAAGGIGELFLSNHKNNSGADTAARDAAIAFSFAVQHGADPKQSAARCAVTAAAMPADRSVPRSMFSPARMPSHEQFT